MVYAVLFGLSSAPSCALAGLSALLDPVADSYFHVQSFGLGNKAMDVDKAMTWTALDASGTMGEGKT